MSAAGFILAINIAVALSFAAAFAWVAAYGHARRSEITVPAVLLMASFLLGAAAFVIEWLISVAHDPRIVVAAAFFTMLVSFALFVAALSAQYRVSFPMPVLGATLIASLALNLAIYEMERTSLVRLLLYQVPYFVVFAFAAGIVWRGRARRPLDRLLMVALALTALHFLLKPFLALALGPGATPQAYVSSTYALVSQTIGAILLIACALIMLATQVRDLLFQAAEISETDPLSGLLNRRGFEERCVSVARSLARRGLPGVIIICDLDHFKKINDTHGHETGDKVIALFASILRNAAGERNLAARIGGEEFAVLLKGANAASGRLFAEGVRGSFATAQLDDQHGELHFTASFGVAEIHPGDDFAGMLRRADAALYEAKAAGRDCVRVHGDGRTQVARAFRP